ncbi:MAG: glycosyltransferase family 2 protein [bacterium]
MALDLSLVIPVFNEEESLPRLLAEIHAALDPTGLAYEVICVDDGSRDQSFAVLQRMAAEDPALVVISFRRNFGQTAAMQAGIDAARGDAVALLDADLQNDPADIPMMLAKLAEGHDMVAGWRADRKDAFINRRLPSILANRIISRVTRVHLHDYGCTLKVMRREVAQELRLYGEMHRFIPAIASWAGARILEVKVNHRARQFGTSKYGIGRTLRVVLDLIVVRFMQSYLVKPMQVFGLMGLVTGFVGTLMCLWLALQKLITGASIGDRPLLLLGVLLIVVGVQLVCTGLVRSCWGAPTTKPRKRPYHVRTRIDGPGFRPAPGADRAGEAP